MKIQINATGQIVDESLNKAQRWINKGIAHVVKEEVKPVGIVEKPVVKKVVEAIKEKVTEIDLIEPTPEWFTSFEKLPEVTKENVSKPKTSKSKKKK